MFQLRALGAADLRTSDGHEVSAVVAQPKRLALLIYLASRTGPTSRDELLSRFWPERDDQHARQSLNQALTFLRRAIGAEAIVSRGEDSVAVNSAALGFDARSFDEAYTRGEWDEAVALYRGDFLDGFFVTDAAAELDDWIARERARLRQAANAAYWHRAERALAARDPHGARACAQFAVALAPDDERGVRRLVDLLESIGDRAGAMRVYDQFAERLHREFGVSPSRELQDLIVSIKAKVRTDTTNVTAVELPAPAPVAPHRRRAPRVVVIAASISIVAIAAAVAMDRFGAAGAGAHRIAVAPFRNATGDSAYDLLSTMAADWVTQELQRAGLAGVIPMETVLQSKTDSLPATVTASARELRRLTGADLAVVGSYYLVNDSLLYDVQIVDATDGSLRGGPVLVPASRGDVMGGLQLLRERVAGSLATLLDPRSQSSVTITSSPPTLPAFQEYVRGMDAFYRRGRQSIALAHFARARAEDTTYVAPLLAAATIYFAMGTGAGNRAQADSVVRIVAMTRNRLSEFERLQLDRWESLLREDLEGSYAASVKIAALAPRSHFVEMHVMDATSTLHLREAVAALEQLDPSWPWVRDWQTYWAVLAYALHDLGDYDRELKAARRARAIRPEYSRFVWLEVQALIGRGRLDEVRARLDECATLPSDPQRGSWTPGDVMRNAALELRAHGHRALAHEVLERGHRWFAAHPDIAAANPPQAQYNRMQRLAELERWNEAAAIADSLVRRDSSNGEAHVVLGRAAAVLGDSARARVEMAFLSHADERGAISARLYGSARIAAQLGDRGTALDLLEAAFAHGQRHTFWDHLEASFEPLRGEARYRALMAPKR